MLAYKETSSTSISLSFLVRFFYHFQNSVLCTYYKRPGRTLPFRAIDSEKLLFFNDFLNISLEKTPGRIAQGLRLSAVSQCHVNLSLRCERNKALVKEEKQSPPGKDSRGENCFPYSRSYPRLRMFLKPASNLPPLCWCRSQQQVKSL